jgi:hypothetical protein
MHKTTIYCDCCGLEMEKSSGAELTGQLRAQGMRWHATGEMDMPAVELRDICDPCAIDMHAAITYLISQRKQAAPSNTEAQGR